MASAVANCEKTLLQNLALYHLRPISLIYGNTLQCGENFKYVKINLFRSLDPRANPQFTYLYVAHALEQFLDILTIVLAWPDEDLIPALDFHVTYWEGTHQPPPDAPPGFYGTMRYVSPSVDNA